jgi:hypothetical protein
VSQKIESLSAIIRIRMRKNVIATISVVVIVVIIGALISLLAVCRPIARANPLTPTPIPTVPPGPCIIATATYGSPLASEVVFMRSVRDDLIGSSPVGSVLVKWWNSFYYSWSPPVANTIVGSDQLKTLFSVLLSPLLGSMYVVAGVYESLAWLSPDLAAVVSFMVAAALSISIYILLPAVAIRYASMHVWSSREREKERE